MHYTVAFYAAKADDLWRTMTQEPDAVLQKVRTYVEEAVIETGDVEPIMAAAASLCQGNVPPDAPQTYFDAFSSILQVLTERIEMSNYQFKHITYFEEIGIWPWTQLERPPFPMPQTTKSNVPLEFGFLPCHLIRETVLPGMEQLPPTTEAKPARMEFAEIAESIADDNLDLFLYYSTW
jgi:hypothetical protein